MEMTELKGYIRVDYDDDDDLIRLMLDAVLDEMAELIQGFNREQLTNRQKVIVCAYVKDLYDKRGKITAETGQERMRFVIQSMLAKEMLRGM